MMRILQTRTSRTSTKFKVQNARSKNKTELLCNLSSTLNFKLLTLNFRRAGFTLLELIVVVFIISLALALIMPSFWVTEKNAVKLEARHISSALRYVYDEAVGKKQIYLFKINLDSKLWGFDSEEESRSFRIKGDVKIRDVVIPSRGEISRGEIIIEFGPMGPEEPIILHLKKGESEHTIIFNHLNGRTRTYEGYIL